MTSTVTPLVFHGPIIHSRSLEALEILENATLVIDASGTITAFKKSEDDDTPIPAVPEGARVHHLGPGEFLIPGFVDTHNHAPQWPMRGIGQGLHILDWLDQVTFPFEARFADAAYARATYEDTVADFLRQGITTASYYSSRHAEATCILADICAEKGQRALVGKCNMDRNAPAYLAEPSAAVSLQETRDCIAHIRALPGCGDPEHALVKPVLTPRFAICCTAELLTGLGDMMRADASLAMQTHFNEAQQEVDATRALFPDLAARSEADLYERFGLLGPRSILAHCTVMTDYDKERLLALGCGVAHCPIANMTVGGGFMVAPVRDLLRRGVKVGLGTDSGGGWASQMLAVMRQAVIASNAREVMDAADKALTLDEVFYLATLGGARVLCLEHEVGSFAVGKQFDASWVATTSGLRSAMTPRQADDGLRRIFEKFVMTGDDRNMAHVYVRGRRVAGARHGEAS